MREMAIIAAGPQLGTWPTPEACALSGSQTRDLSVHRPALSPLNHISQGENILFFLNDSFLFPIFFSFIDSRDRGREGEREEEKHRCEKDASMVASCTCPNWGLKLHVPGLGTNW